MGSPVFNALDLPKEGNKTAATNPFIGINVRNPKGRDRRGGDRALRSLTSGFSRPIEREAQSHRRGRVS